VCRVLFWLAMLLAAVMVIHMIILAAFLFSRWRTPILLHFPRPELLVLLIALAAIAQGSASKPVCLSKGTFACCTAFPFACCCTTFRLALLFPLHAAPLFPLHAAPLQSICKILMLSCSTNFVMLSCCTLHSFTPALCCHQTVCVHVGCLAVQLPSPSCALQACFHACMGPCKWTHDMSLKHVDSDLLCFADLFRLAVLCRHIQACCAVMCCAVQT